jgi:Fur family transcriptional regulator, ferric uptake regulator
MTDDHFLMAEHETGDGVLKETGLRKTIGRVKIVELLMSAQRPLTGAELIALLGRDSMDPASVYRVLTVFTERRIVHRIDGADNVSRYALNRGRANHPHFTCRSCGRMDCLEKISVPHLDAGPDGYVVEAESLFLSGICARCSKK